MNLSDLKIFLTCTMNMSGIQQPVIIRELLMNDGQATKDQLAKAVAEYDLSVNEYYRRNVMRWPKTILSKHGIIRYKRNGELFLLNCSVSGQSLKKELIALCDSKIQDWIQGEKGLDKIPVPDASVRYRILKKAKGKCELCGIPASLSPIDIDHIVPRSKAGKNGKVMLHGKRIDLHSEDNLQALCFRCNRAKRDKDNTDFRRTKKLVRDRIPDIIRESGREPTVRQLTGKALVKALNEKLVEEHEEYIESRSVEELADMVEVILSLARGKGISQDDLLRLVEKKRSERGGFEEGLFYEGDK